MTRIIGLSGLAGSGKTEAAKALENAGYVRISFATPLKQMLQVLVPEGTDKNERPPLLQGKTYREALQTLGTDWGRQMIGPDIWCNAAMSIADRLVEEGKNVVFDDVRFDNEAQAIVDRGGFVIRITRPGVNSMGHASEAGISPKLIGGTLFNDDSIEYLHNTLFQIIQRAESDADLTRMLENRHEVYLKWVEPWPACGPEGNDLSAHVEIRATVHDCINMERNLARASGRETAGNDRDRLLDFMAVHWATCIND